MAVKEYVSKKVSNLTRYGKNVTNFDYLKEQNKDLKDVALKVFSTKNILKNAKKETFVNAQKRLGLKEIDMLEVYRAMSINFYTYLIISFILFFIALYTLFIAKLAVATVVVLTIIGISLANCFRYSFRAFQVKNRKLCPVLDWYKSGEYLPDIIRSNNLNTFIIKKDVEDEEDLDEELDEEQEKLLKDEQVKFEEELKLADKLLKEKIKLMEYEYEIKLKNDKEKSLLYLESLKKQYLTDSEKNETKGDLL